MSFIVRYTNAHGEVHSKVFENEREAVAAWDKLQKLKKKYSLTKIEAVDSFCCTYFGHGIWD